MDCRLGFELDINTAVYKQVGSKPAVQTNCVVNNGDWLFLDNFKATFTNFVGQTFAIGCFKQARSKSLMDFDGCSDDCLRYRIQVTHGIRPIGEVLKRGDAESAEWMHNRISAFSAPQRFNFMYCGSCRILEIVDDPL